MHYAANGTAEVDSRMTYSRSRLWAHVRSHLCDGSRFHSSRNMSSTHNNPLQILHTNSVTPLTQN
jgi:hypothetical protein